jgi:methyl-accepting chemotaxis protein
MSNNTAIKMSITSKLTMLLISFAMMAAMGVAVQFFIQRNIIKDVLIKNIGSIAVSINDTVERNLFERYGDVQAFGVNEIVKQQQYWKSPGPDNKLVKAMNQYMVKYGIYRLMMLVSTNGEVLAVNNVDGLGKTIATEVFYQKSFKDADWLKKAMAGEFLKGSNGLDGTVVEEPEVDAGVAKLYNDDGIVMKFAAPVYDDAGKIIAVWVNYANFDLVEDIILHYFRSLYEKAGLSGIDIHLVNKNGASIVDLDAGTVGKNIRYQPLARFNKPLDVDGIAPILAKLSKGEIGNVTINTHEQSDLLILYAKTDGGYDYPGLGWSVVIKVPYDQLFSMINLSGLLITITVTLVVLSIAGIIIGRRVSKPIKEVASVMSELSRGNYNVRVDIKVAKDEIGLMVEALNASITKIREVVIAIKGNTEIVSVASSEISQGSIDLAQRTEQQASSLEETAASMEQITDTVRRTSDNAAKAVGVANKACETAEKGGEVMKNQSKAMHNIEDSSNKISQIINVIDEIAFQTNLLALNAAVEAARAGEAGKGFAVVAAEVRSLAGRSAEASKEIKALINASAEQVQIGVDLTKKAGDTLHEIVGSIQHVASIIHEISAATNEQSGGIGEINVAISQMDQVTQQNAALVEENTAATQSLVQQAKQLMQMISFFNIDDRDGFRKLPNNHKLNEDGI